MEDLEQYTRMNNLIITGHKNKSQAYTAVDANSTEQEAAAFLLSFFNRTAISKIEIKPEKYAGIEIHGHELYNIRRRRCFGYVYVQKLQL